MSVLTMKELSANLVAVQWGVLSVFGVVIGLLIAPAERHLQEFLASGADDDQRRAARWSYSVRMASVLVFFFLFGLSILGALDFGWRDLAWSSITSWLLLTPLIAQVGFVILVLFLVRSVPPIHTLPLNQPPKYAKSLGGRRDRTIIRFINETSVALEISWLNFDGQQDPERGPSVPPGKEEAAYTYEGHRFLIKTKDGKDVVDVEAAATPGKVVIKPAHIEAARRRCRTRPRS